MWEFKAFEQDPGKAQKVRKAQEKEPSCLEKDIDQIKFEIKPINGEQ